MALHDRSIHRQLTTLTVLSSAVGLVLAAAALIAYGWSRAQSGYERDLETVAQIVADNSTGALAFSDRAAGNETLAALRAKPEIRLACLYINTEEYVFAEYRAAGAGPCPPQPGATGLFRDAQSLTRVTEVQIRGERAGRLRLTQTLDPLYAMVGGQVAITMLILGLSFSISLAIASFMQGAISKPVINLAATARRVAESRDYSLRAEGGGHNELGQLVNDFNHMLLQVALSEHEVRQARDALTLEVRQKTKANAELEGTLQRLQQTQAQLVQSEKLASLGALVAGVAHEINTPVGVGVTAASTLRARALKFRSQHEPEAARSADLAHFIEVVDESTRIVLTNLERAANLIRSFKQVAVDQSSNERRRFAVKKYIEEVLTSLGPTLRRSGHVITVHCPESLVIDSFPGVLAQILTNLINNSLIHAFAEHPSGHMDIHVRESKGQIELRYTDDGCGMPPADVSRVFDPFFTTKRGLGGSGLGMHIVYNLVTQILRGQIQVDSAIGRGVDIRVNFPATPAPVTHENPPPALA